MSIIVNSIARSTLIGFLIFLNGCEFASGFRYSNTAREFFDKSQKEQEEQFNTYSLEDAYEIYMYGTQVKHHPSGQWLVDPFSLRGSEAVPFLKVKLIETPTDGMIADIIRLFYWMSWRKTHDVAHDTELMALMMSTVNDITDQHYKQRSQLYLTKITAPALPTDDAVEFLKQRLDEANDLWTIRTIIEMLSEMSRQKTYDVAADVELMALMESAINRIKDDFHKQYTEKILKEISASP